MVGVSYNPKIVTDGLVLCLDAANRRSYPGAGTTWSDLSGNGNNGTLTNGPTFTSDNGGNIVFDGTNDYVDCGNTAQTFYCINIWFYINSTVTKITNSYGFFRYSNTGVQEGVAFGAVTGLVTDETLTMLSQVGGSYPRTVIKDNIPFGWNNVIFNWNGSSYDIYLNNTKRTTYSSGAGHVNLINSSGLFLGQNFLAGNNRFNGKMSYFSIYNRSLSFSEIQKNYNATRGRYGI